MPLKHCDDCITAISLFLYDSGKIQSEQSLKQPDLFLPVAINTYHPAENAYFLAKLVPHVALL